MLKFFTHSENKKNPIRKRKGLFDWKIARKRVLFVWPLWSFKAPLVNMTTRTLLVSFLLNPLSQFTHTSPLSQFTHTSPFSPFTNKNPLSQFSDISLLVNSPTQALLVNSPTQALLVYSPTKTPTATDFHIRIQKKSLLFSRQYDYTAFLEKWLKKQ